MNHTHAPIHQKNGLKPAYLVLVKIVGVILLGFVSSMNLLGQSALTHLSETGFSDQSHYAQPATLPFLLEEEEWGTELIRSKRLSGNSQVLISIKAIHYFESASQSFTRQPVSRTRDLHILYQVFRL